MHSNCRSKLQKCQYCVVQGAFISQCVLLPFISFIFNCVLAKTSSKGLCLFICILIQYNCFFLAQWPKSHSFTTLCPVILTMAYFFPTYNIFYAFPACQINCCMFCVCGTTCWPKIINMDPNEHILQQCHHDIEHLCYEGATCDSDMQLNLLFSWNWCTFHTLT